MRRRRPPVRENPLTPTHGREPRSSVQAFPLPGVRPNKTDAASATGDSVRWCVYGFWGRGAGSGFRTLAGAPPVSRPAPRRRLPRAVSRARRVGAASGGRPRFRGSAAGRPTPRSSPGCTTPRRERSAACGPCAVPLSGRWPGCWPARPPRRPRTTGLFPTA